MHQALNVVIVLKRLWSNYGGDVKYYNAPFSFLRTHVKEALAEVGVAVCSTNSIKIVTSSNRAPGGLNSGSVLPFMLQHLKWNQEKLRDRQK